MSVYDNLAFGLRNKKAPEAEIKAAIDRAAGMLGLHELFASASPSNYPRQQQRVALGPLHRAQSAGVFVRRALSNLDGKSCAPDAHRDLAACGNSDHVGVRTHDQVEAMTLGDRVVIMRDGRIQQMAPRFRSKAGPPTSSWPVLSRAGDEFIEVTVPLKQAQRRSRPRVELTPNAAEARAISAHNGEN